MEVSGVVFGSGPVFGFVGIGQLGPAHGQMAAGGQPGGGRVGPVEAMATLGREPGGGPGHHRLQAVELAVQGFDGLTVGQHSHIGVHQSVDVGFQLRGELGVDRHYLLPRAGRMT